MSVHSVAVRRPHQTLAAVQAGLGFTRRAGETLFSYAYDPPPEGEPKSNVVLDERIVSIADVRPIAGDLSVDRQGFELIAHRTAVRDFWDEAQTLAFGHPEAAEIVKAATGASRVVVFDHTLRRRVSGVQDHAPGAPRQPATRVHVDQTLRSGPQRIRDLMGEAAEAALRKRTAIVNVWRPIERPARDWPLAVADARTIEADDLIPSELRFRHRTGEVYGLAANRGQQWFYVPDQQPDEVLLIKCWDSDSSVARFTPHTAFEDPTTPPGTPPRESIEFRTLAFFD